MDNNNLLKNIKSKYILKQIFENISEYILMKLIKYNKKIQNRLEIGVNDYKKFNQIEIEIIPINREDNNKFINIQDEDKSYFHIYFNDDKKEIKTKYFTKYDKINKIKIIIDLEIKSFKNLFKYCNCIEKIRFLKFNRKEVNNMSGMFYDCRTLKELNLKFFHTNNVTDMSYMFYNCESIEKLYLKNFNTNNVIDMSYMFSLCSSLKELDLNNFNTKNVINMSCMFYACSSLNKLIIDNFNTSNVTNISRMLCGCSSLKELNLNNFNITIFLFIFVVKFFQYFINCIRF